MIDGVTLKCGGWLLELSHQNALCQHNSCRVVNPSVFPSLKLKLLKVALTSTFPSIQGNDAHRNSFTRHEVGWLSSYLHTIEP